MTYIHLTLLTIFAGFIVACSPTEEPKSHDNSSTKQVAQINNDDTMRTGFMASCRARPEFVSRRRAGTIDAYCKCIFDKTMRGLSADERIVAGFYLYGEQNKAFLKRYKGSAIDPQTMATAAKAVGKAAKSCR